MRALPLGICVRAPDFGDSHLVRSGLSARGKDNMVWEYHLVWKPTLTSITAPEPFAGYQTRSLQLLANLRALETRALGSYLRIARLRE